MYQFTEDCLTGYETIDEEHRQLFQTINEIAETLMDETKSAQEVLLSAKNLVYTLKEYASTHFAHEEEYMEKIHDPELPRQQRACRIYGKGEQPGFRNDGCEQGNQAAAGYDGIPVIMAVPSYFVQ